MRSISQVNFCPYNMCTKHFQYFKHAQNALWLYLGDRSRTHRGFLVAKPFVSLMAGSQSDTGWKGLPMIHRESVTSMQGGDGDGACASVQHVDH